MATIKIFSDESNQYYTVNFELKSTNLSDGVGTLDFYLLVSTTMKTKTGATQTTFLVKDLTDVPPGGSSPAADFTELMQQYVTYYVAQAGMEESSSSSSSSISSLSSASSKSSSSSTSQSVSSFSSGSSSSQSDSSSSIDSHSSSSSSSVDSHSSSSSSSSTLP